MNRSTDESRLRTTLGVPGLARVMAALRRRIELGRPIGQRLTLANPSAAERAACDALLGRRPTRGGTLSLDLADLEALLREAGLCEDLETAVRTINGPIVNRRESARVIDRLWDQFWVSAQKGWPKHPALAGWLDQLRASGLLKRLAHGDPVNASFLLGETARTLAALPVRGEPLAAFAARVHLHAHALDPDRPYVSLLMRAVAQLGGVPFEDDTEGRRAVWASVGVVCDELSSPVLALNLPASGAGPLARMLRAAAEAGEPLHLSLRILLGHPLSTEPDLAGRVVFVCENPTVIALAVSRFGSRCAPLVCVGGQPATPAMVLLRQLKAAGARLRYHGDFDPGGLVIARRLFAELDAKPWRFGAADYADAPKGKPFEGDPGPTPWSPGLGPAMREFGCAVHEEALFDFFLADDLELNGPTGRNPR